MKGGSAMNRGSLAVPLATIVFSLLAGPVPAAEQKLIGAVSGELFGASVSLSTTLVEADRVLVGAPGCYESTTSFVGRAVVLEKEGIYWYWRIPYQVTSQNLEFYDICGAAVKLYYDRALVGIPGHDGSALSDIGNIATLRHDGESWSNEGYESPSTSLSESSHFGSAIDLWGSYGVVGAPDTDVSFGEEAMGKAFIYKDMGSYWEYSYELWTAAVGADDRFGTSVAIYSDWAMVGAPGDDDKGSNSGAVYVFKRDGTRWVKTQKLTMPYFHMEAAFGKSLAITAWWLAVGAPFSGGGGAVYLFEKVDNDWVFRYQVTASNRRSDYHFGRSLALWSSNLIVGCPDTYLYGVDAGIVYSFHRSGSEWVEQGWLVPSDIAAGDRFGQSVTLFQTTVMVGAPYDDNIVGTDTDTGAVYLYDLADFQAHVYSDSFELGDTSAWSATVN
jgi:hypothetical protein